MQWSPQQESALRAVSAWMKTDLQTFYLAGYAGTGKTTLVKHFAENVRHIQYLAYTGKAAYVMRSKGCEGAKTIHSAIYIPTGDITLDKLKQRKADIENNLADPAVTDSHKDSLKIELQVLLGQIANWKDGASKPLFMLNPESEIPFMDLVIIDEASMVDGYIGQDIEKLAKKILVLGDPAQLPPVGSGGYFTSRTPNITLTEVHRQASESGILRLATLVRNGGRLVVGNYGDAQVIRRTDSDLLRDLAMRADQLLVGKNATRHALNNRMRELKGITESLPVAGDRIVCLRNNHKTGLLNGSLWTVDQCTPQASVVDDDLREVLLQCEVEIPPEDTLAMKISPATNLDGEIHQYVHVWPHHFIGKEAELNIFVKRDAEEFDYGYALTVHKSQGSQWDDVVVYDESASFRQDAQKHLYTAITRAAKSLTVAV